MDGTSKAPDVAVIGAGIIGCAVALELARAGASVAVLERGAPGREATWAAGGMLSPLSESLEPGPFLELGMESLRLYPKFARKVARGAGRAVDVEESGKLQVALEPPEVEELRDRGRRLREAGFDARWLDADDVREMGPGLAPAVRHGLFLAQEGLVDNRLLAEAVPDAARAAGVRIHASTRVRGVARRGPALNGVKLVDGSTFASGAVVVAAGAWSGRLEGLPRPLPVRPVRGQMLSLELEPGAVETVVETSDAYLIPRPGGPLVVGSTMEEVGFDAIPTEEGIAALLAAARRALPALAGASPLETWAGLRPGTPDHAPVMGEDPEVPGLFYATGHFRNGILLAPVTALSLASLVTGEGDPPVDLTPFRPDRFTDSVLVPDSPTE